MSVGEIEVRESGIKDGTGRRNTEVKHPNNPKLPKINVQSIYYMLKAPKTYQLHGLQVMGPNIKIMHNLPASL